MGIKTDITIKELMRLNPSIKTVKQANKILHDVKTNPSINLEEFMKPICKECKGSIIYYRKKSNSFICRTCGYEWIKQVKKLT